MKLYAILYDIDYDGHNMLHSVYADEMQAMKVWESLNKNDVGTLVQLVSFATGDVIEQNEFETLYSWWEGKP